MKGIYYFEYWISKRIISTSKMLNGMSPKHANNCKSPQCVYKLYSSHSYKSVSYNPSAE